MKMPRLAPLLLTLTWASWLSIALPSACTPAVTMQAESAGTGQTPGTLSRATALILPHPAFAFAAEQSGGNTVSIADIAERVSPSVVSVSSQRLNAPQARGRFPSPFPPGFGPRSKRPSRPSKGLGSGVIVSADGLIITNNHVVENANEITVDTGSGQYSAKIVGTDKKSDIAVLRLLGDFSGLVPLQYGDSSNLRIGDVVLAIGNPFGVGKTVTMGIVSAKGRSETRIVDYSDFIQTDAAINPGNSGGALVNMRGELVGINTAILSHSGGYQGIGFAIPSNMARPISESLLKHGRVARGYLGIEIQDLNPKLQAALGLKSSHGVLISHVLPQQAGAKGGLKQGDVVWSLNGNPTESVSRLRNLVAATGPKQEVVLELTRDGKRQELTVVLGELESESRAQNHNGKKTAEPLAGLSVETLNPTLRRRIDDLPKQVRTGVVVVGVKPGSSAARSGLRPGDVIVEAAKKPIAKAKQFRKVQAAAKNTPIPLLVYRGGRALYLALEQ